MQWSVEQVARALGVVAPAGLDPVARLAGISIDSRTVQPGELFLAIHGPRHDGHNFVAAAVAAGALGAVVAQDRRADYPEELRGKLIAVADTLAALQELARAVRRAWGRRLAGITGSTGKTTTKEILAALLSARLRVLKSEGNLNNEFGLPLALLKLEGDHEAAVVELGMSRAGEIARLARIAEPEVGLVTCVAPVHLEFFDSVDAIARAKRELIEGLTGGDPVAVLNADDARVARFSEGFAGRVLRFGAAPDAHFRAVKIAGRGAEGTTLETVTPQGAARLEISLPGRHNAMNALAALAAASLWGVGLAEARDVFPRLKPAAMRSEVLRLADDITVINDAYNSNPVALAAAVEMLAAMGAAGRRIVAAGEMLELGPASAELHRHAGHHIAATPTIDWLLCVRGLAAEMAAGALEAGMDEQRVRFFASAEEAAECLAAMAGPGDVVLVKGSRGVQMETAVAALTERFPAGEAAERRAK